LYKRNRVHIRPDHPSTCDVMFNPTYTSTCDVVPSPSSHTSVVASQNAPPAVNDTVAHARPPQTTGTITRLCVILNSVPNRPHPDEKGMLMMFVHGTSA